MAYRSSSVSSVALGATSTYESNTIQSSYSVADGVPITGASLQGGSLGTDTVAETSEPVVVSKPAVDSDAAMLTVTVPEGAKVTVNGHETSSDGAVRQFMSRGLKEGFVYTYVVQVSYELDGEQVTESKSVKLRAGEIEDVEFTAAQSQPAVEAEAATPKQQDLVTVVKIHVPADAKVTLAGNDTNGSGSVRTFRTKQLKEGQQWTGYTVRVTTNLNGQPMSLERSLDVDAGSRHELTFDFISQTVASR